jgi:O-antigen ligase
MTTVYYGQRSPHSTNRSWAALCATGLLALGALAAPLAFGATEVGGYCALQILVAIAAVFWIVSPRGDRPRRPWLPLAVAAIGLIQLLPLPASQLRPLAPYSAEARESAADLIGQLGRGSVSIHPARTLAALRRCMMLALVVVMAADLSRFERERRFLLRAVAAAGMLILVLGLVVGAGPNGKALGFHDMRGYWKFYKNPLLTGFHSIGMGAPDIVTVGGIHYLSDSPIGGSAVGAMINANHFAVCVGLTTPLVVSLLVSGSICPIRDPRVRWMLALGDLALATYAIVVPAHARAGFVALGLSALVIALLAPARNKPRALLTMVGIAALGMGGALLLVSLGLLPRLDGRASTWQAVLEMFRSSPWLGVGLGNYQTVYPALQQGPIAYFAHSAWLEWAAETGTIGLLLLAVTLAFGVRTVGRIWEWPAPGPRRMVRLGVVGGILFAALHGAVDHGIQIPANAYLCALLIGLLLGDVHADRSTNAAAPLPSRSGWRVPICQIVVSVIGCLLIWGAQREWSADRLIFPLRKALAMQRVPLDERRLDEKPQLLHDALPAAQFAFSMTPKNAEFAETIGQAFLHLSRGESGPELEAAQDWFRRSLRICPINPALRQTLTEIRARLRPSQSKE